jgi:hypothetical protein
MLSSFAEARLLLRTRPLAGKERAVWPSTDRPYYGAIAALYGNCDADQGFNVLATNPGSATPLFRGRVHFYSPCGYATNS